MLSLAITHYNRADLLLESISLIHDDPRIAEIVISDDCSHDGSYERLQKEFRHNAKVCLHQNEQNRDVYANKARALSLCSHLWCVLFDSDNLLTPEYLSAIFALHAWEPNTFYLPVFAEPHFDYRAFSGQTITRQNVSQFMSEPMFPTALNTANHLVNRDEYLRVWEPGIDPHTSDSIYMNLLWLKAGGSLYFVPSMHYFHRIHSGSHFMTDNHKTGNFAAKVEAQLRKLR